MSKFLVKSRFDIEYVKPPTIKHIVVSITDPDSKPARIIKCPELIGLIRLQFYDLEFERQTYKTITLEEAARIVWFINKHYNSIDLIIVHCEAGISRSSGVVSALSLLIEGKDIILGDGRYSPNGLVFSKILEAWKSWKEAEDDIETFLSYNRNKQFNFTEDSAD